jgi:hypothetical protein
MKYIGTQFQMNMTLQGSQLITIAVCRTAGVVALLLKTPGCRSCGRYVSRERSAVKQLIKIFTIVLSFTSIASVAKENIQEDVVMPVSGVFEVKLEPQKDESAPAGRMTIFKEYSGGLVGKGIGQMISKRTEGGTSVYSAIEEFEGTLNGKNGAFTFFHNGSMSSSKQELEVVIVEGSGSGELDGIQGELSITQENGTHKYELQYSL